MFLKYYNLMEQPFGVTPDPRFLYLNHMYREALASLWYGVKERRGFMLLVAPPGMGKTTLLFQLLQRLRSQRARTAFLFQTCCASRDLIQYLLHELGILPLPDLASMHQQLNDVLVREARLGNQFVFVIDEAQNLSPAVLESVRLLSDFEIPQGKLLQIILAGQSPLLATLRRPEMVQLSQRIAITTCLDPLSPGEARQYIAHRLGLAGHEGTSLFTSGAMELIARESGGIPRNINNLCFNALSAGFALRRQQIDAAIVQEVLADQDLDQIERRVALPPSNEQRALYPDSKPRKVPAAGRVQQILGPWGRQACRALYVAIMVAALTLTTGESLRSVAADPLVIDSYISSGTRAENSPAKIQAASAPRAKHGMVRVETGDTLRQISLRYLGRYSNTIAQKIQAANPQLLDPDHIEVGQLIRLPNESVSNPTPSGNDGFGSYRSAEVKQP